MLPALPANVVGGGEVILEVTVGAGGQVTAVTPLRATPPFTELTTAAVRGWRFTPATDIAPARPGEPASRVAVESRVLVAAVFRPPALSGPTLGELPKDLATASARTPYPLTMVMPPFPPMASASGVVLLEANVDGRGEVTASTVIRSAPPFDGAAQAALSQWKFRPAQAGGAARVTRVYALFGFPVPVGIG
jgi:TonB family protein